MFSRVHRLDIPALVARLTAKPSIRVHAGMFVGSLGGEEYVLGTVRAGLPAAILRIAEFRRDPQKDSPCPK